METDYPAGDTVAIGVTPDRAEEFALRLRVPGWSEATELRVNGESVPVEPGTYAIVRRTWAPGDTVTLKLDARARAVAMPGGQPYTAVVRGPVVLAFDKRITRDLGRRRLGGTAGSLRARGLVEVRPAPRPVASSWRSRSPSGRPRVARRRS